MSDLAQELLRFRINFFAFVSDIENAFLMVQVHLKEQIYRYTAALFRVTCSQLLLNATVIKHLASIREEQGTIDTINKRPVYQNTDNSQE